jgi:serine beta-lactamase-like protein LACTB, mitochondrial
MRRISGQGRWRVRSFCFLIAGTAAGVHAQTPAQIHEVEAYVNEYVHSQHIPGMSLALALHGRLVWARGVGMADLENQVPVDTLTMFPTASTLKPLTATAVLQLAEHRRLDLDAPIQRYCPAYPEKRYTVTAHALLLHQGGIRPSIAAEVFNRTHYMTVTDAVRAFAQDSLQFEPGTATLYSNQGFVLLACAIEGASGESYDDYLARAVLAPANMRHTVPENVYKVTPHASRSYVIRTAENTKQWEGLWTPAQLASIELDVPAVADPVDASWEPGAGNYRSTPSDMVRFVLALEQGALLTDSMRAKEFTRQALRPGALAKRGYGWTVTAKDSGNMPVMLGSNWDGSFGVVTDPQTGFVLALASNIEFNIPSDLVLKIAAVFGYHLDL